MRALVVLALVALAGCAAIEPTDVRMEVNHTSHVLQHFCADPTNYGFTDLAAVVHWDIKGRFYAEMSEGIDVGGRSDKQREAFNARAGIKLWSKQ